MTSLAVFDFDRTIVDDDSDATIISRLKDSKPPEWDSSLKDWTPYMSNVFEHAFTSGLSQEEILSCIGSMRPTPGVEQLISTLAAEGWDVVLITDANSVFVHHWLKVHDLEQAVTAVITNRAFWESGRLFIEPCMSQSVCARCPANLCKSLALAQWCAGRQYARLVYSGDGRNDFCPATNLPGSGTVFARRGFPLDALTKAAQTSMTSPIQAKVVTWDDCYTILEEIFPGKTAGRSIEECSN